MHNVPSCHRNRSVTSQGACKDTGIPILNSLYLRKAALNRHLVAPLLIEREQYLVYLLRRGANPDTLKHVAVYLLIIIRILGLKHLRMVQRAEVENAIAKYSQRRYRSGSTCSGSASSVFTKELAIKFLRFHHSFRGVLSKQPFKRQLNAFKRHLENLRFSTDTIRTHPCKVASFLRWFATRKKTLRQLEIKDVNRFIASQKAGGSSVVSIVTTIGAVRSFCRYAAKRGWCKKGLAELISAPRHRSHSGPEKGRPWGDVQRLLSSISGNDIASVRAKAIVSLLATYALRSGELARLTAEDFDWEKGVIIIRRSKNGPVQRCFLPSNIGRNVLRYIRLRPACPSDRLFVTLTRPYRPVTTGSLSGLMHWRLASIGVTSGPRGPHLIRHAKATYLLNRGRSLRDIGNLLGHRDPDSPFTYAKFDLELLRPVANFSLRGLM
jgi:site-specific recombinase XerD